MHFEQVARLAARGQGAADQHLETMEQGIASS